MQNIKYKIENVEKFVLLCLIFFIYSCASFRNGSVEAIQHFPKSEKKYSVYIDINFYDKNDMLFAKIDEKTYENSVKSINIELDKKIRKKLEESHLFEISSNKQNAQYVLDIRYETYTDMSIGMYLLNAITFDVIPWYTKNSQTIICYIIENNSKNKTVLSVHDTLTTWSTLLLIPVMPFKFPNNENNQMQKDLIDNLAIKIYEKISHDYD